MNAVTIGLSGGKYSTALFRRGSAVHSMLRSMPQFKSGFVGVIVTGLNSSTSASSQRPAFCASSAIRKKSLNCTAVREIQRPSAGCGRIFSAKRFDRTGSASRFSMPGGRLDSGSKL
jgi:hypothetical protein